MQLQDTCVKNILLCLNESLKKQKSVTFNDVMSAPQCKKYSVSDIGKALELLRRNGYVKANSRFGCSELLEFTATAITEKGQEYIKSI